MTWTRKECKVWAKEALQRNYWKIVFVSFLMLIFCGNYPAASSWHSSSSDQNIETQADEAAIDIETETVDSSTEAIDSDTETAGFPAHHLILVPEKAQIVGIVVFILICMLAVAVLYILQALLLNPFRVGLSRFMLKSIDGRAEVKEIAFGYDHSYKNIVRAMFHYDIRVFLWSLLFLIPGFYKAYEYRLVPYILAEHPDMGHREALRRSSILMKGNKWRSFMLDLSFILWHILGIMTCGIVEIFYTAPYHNLTLAALYRKLNGIDMMQQEQPETMLPGSLQ